MSSVCFYFQVHQPFRLKKFSVFNQQNDLDYFSPDNEVILKKVAEKCYLPTNQVIYDLIQKYPDKFRVSFSLSGVAIEQFEKYSPETLDSFKRLVATGNVEILGETYYHSLAAVYDKEEFYAQVKKHSDCVKKHFGVTPQVFRNTELIYQDYIGQMVSDLGFKAIVAEGADDVLDWRSPNFIYQVPGRDCSLMLKNYRLSDDVAFRFSNQGWKEFPLTAEKFASWVHQISGGGDVLNLFMDYETFGEHQWANTGIFDFLWHLPEFVLRHPDWEFATISEAIAKYPRVSEMHFGRLTSWADLERDLTAWNGNQIQQKSLRQIYEIKDLVLKSESNSLIDTWRKIQTSDHYYYMCTKWFADGDVHAYFSPYDSPYDAFINFQNVLANFSQLLAKQLKTEYRL